MNQDFIRTAKAKGVLGWRIIWVHALKNSVLPLVTVFANVFPALIGGSVILEKIFTIPGMGLTTFQAISHQDIPMIMAIFFITGILTVIGYLVTDIMYSLVDPRIRFGKGR